MNRLAIALSLPLGAALLLQANPSQALSITPDGTNYYNALLFEGTLTDLLASPLAPPSATNFPWWTNNVLAGNFANAYYAAAPGTLQYLDDAGLGTTELGPLFYSNINTFVAYNTNQQAPDFDGSAFIQIGSCDISTAFNCDTAITPPTVWAYVQPVPPVPAPLPLLGATAAFSFSRKLRRRVNAQKFTF
jgi:hypothetical protein